MNFAQFMCELMSKPPTYSTKDIYKEISSSKSIQRITEKVLKMMFCENTGAHVLDSGGARGRGWQRSEAIKDLDWLEADTVNIEVDRYHDGEYYFAIRKNTYLFLVNLLRYDVEMDKKFHEFAESPELKQEGYWKCVKEFVDEFNESRDYCFAGNTYNFDNLLDCTLQYHTFTINGEGYLLLQTHNGCDVRGGYSAPHVFSVDVDEFIMYMSDITARCPNFTYKKKLTGQRTLEGEMIMENHVDCYSDDSGYHWYGNSGSNEFKFITTEEGEHKVVCPECGSELEFF